MKAPPKKRAVKKEARVFAKTMRQKSRTVRKGSRLANRGENQLAKAKKQESKAVSKARKTGEVGKGAVSKRIRYKKEDANKKIVSGESMMKNPTPKARPERRVYRSAKAMTGGKNARISRSGKKVYRKK